MAADELGISEEEFRDFRTPEQLEALDKAERCRRMAFSIPNNVPRPPLKRPRAQGQRSTGPDKLFIPRGRTAHTKLPPHGCGAS
jgi:hypothetical protein